MRLFCRFPPSYPCSTVRPNSPNLPRPIPSPLHSTGAGPALTVAVRPPQAPVGRAVRTTPVSAICPASVTPRTAPTSTTSRRWCWRRRRTACSSEWPRLRSNVQRSWNSVMRFVEDLWRICRLVDDLCSLPPVWQYHCCTVATLSFLFYFLLTRIAQTSGSHGFRVERREGLAAVMNC